MRAKPAENRRGPMRSPPHNSPPAGSLFSHHLDVNHLDSLFSPPLGSGKTESK